MRLLEILLNGDIRLTRKWLIPRYAILLHTWEDDSKEVTFEDMVRNYSKLRNWLRQNTLSFKSPPYFAC